MNLQREEKARGTLCWLLRGTEGAGAEGKATVLHVSERTFLPSFPTWPDGL